jgi:FG-GAP repeat protein (fragment)
MIDINGDGLPGIITASGGHLDVAYNTGDGFLPQVRFMNNAPLGESVSMSVSRFGNVGVPIPAFLVKIIIRTIAATAQGVSRTSTAQSYDFTYISTRTAIHIEQN